MHQLYRQVSWNTLYKRRLKSRKLWVTFQGGLVAGEGGGGCTLKLDSWCYRYRVKYKPPLQTSLGTKQQTYWYLQFYTLKNLSGHQTQARHIFSSIGHLWDCILQPVYTPLTNILYICFFFSSWLHLLMEYENLT